MKRLLFLMLCGGLALASAAAQPAGTRTLTVDAAATDAALAADASLFRSLRDALRAAEALQSRESFSADEPLTVRIAPSVYWLDDPDDPAVRLPREGGRAPFGIELRLSHLRLVGMGDGPEQTVIASNRGQTHGAEGNFTMIYNEGDDWQVENLTFGNYCNVDLVYPDNPSLNRTRRADAIVQAQLIIVDGDRYLARNCRFISRLNLCPFAGARRALFENCYFECTDDALCGTGVYLGCRFTLFSGKPFYTTQGAGAVFLDCDLHTRTRGRQYLVKVDAPVTLIDCRWTSEDPDLRLGWCPAPTADTGGYLYHVTLNGAPCTFDTDRPERTVDLAGLPLLEAYRTVQRDGTVHYRLDNLVGGEDNWNPLADTPPARHPAPQATRLQLLPDRERLRCGSDTLRIASRQLLPGYEAVPPEPVRWSVSEEDAPKVALRPNDDGSCTVTGTDFGEEPCTVRIVATTPSGLRAACSVVAEPSLLPPPAFTEAPRLLRSGDTLRVLYGLDLGGRADRSQVVWFRRGPVTCDWPLPVALSHTGTPRTEYRLTEADNGCRIEVMVAPQHSRSLKGEPLTAITDEAVEVAPGTGPHRLETDFSDFPTSFQPLVAEGFWTVDACKPADTHAFDWEPEPQHAWYYGRGVDGAAGSQGLIEATRGARLRYTPARPGSGDMTVTLEVDPCKGPGQGFGSATGQYLDLCLQFDTRTLTGYGLRIFRTPHHDRAVDFVLVAYRNGLVEPLGEAVTADCFRTTCTLELRTEGDRLTARARCSQPRADDDRAERPNLPGEVALEATIRPARHGGLAIQHTGSVGASAAVLRKLTVVWEP